jgi:hypothetical protein
MSFTIPDRVGDMTGSAWAAIHLLMPMGPLRDEAVLQQMQLGNVPDFLRAARAVSTTAGPHSATFSVLPDVLCIGTDDDFVRVPVGAPTAQKIANLFGATLITRFLSDTIWKLADVVLSPFPMPPTSEMCSTKWFVDHNHKVELARAGRSGLVAGHKKDVVLANALSAAPGKVAIYGWHQLNGRPIQPLNATSHDIAYCDYSHGIRLVDLDMTVDDVEADFYETAGSSTLYPLVNPEGPLSFKRYATS